MCLGRQLEHWQTLKYVGVPTLPFLKGNNNFTELWRAHTWHIKIKSQHWWINHPTLIYFLIYLWYNLLWDWLFFPYLGSFKLFVVLFAQSSPFINIFYDSVFCSIKETSDFLDCLTIPWSSPLIVFLFISVDTRRYVSPHSTLGPGLWLGLLA